MRGRRLRIMFVDQEHSEPDFIVGNIGIAAGLTVKEGDHAPRFAPYRHSP